MRRDADRVDDILEAIAKIQSRALVPLDSFLEDEMLQIWVIHYLQVIGEAARGVSPPLRQLHPEVEWPQLIALRNILVHEYFGLNLEQVWTMARNELPRLKAKLLPLRGSL